MHNAYLKGRTQNTQLYKPGSQELLLLFSDRDGEGVYQFPMYEQLEDVLEPILLQVVSRKRHSHLCMLSDNVVTQDIMDPSEYNFLLT